MCTIQRTVPRVQTKHLLVSSLYRSPTCHLQRHSQLMQFSAMFVLYFGSQREHAHTKFGILNVKSIGTHSYHCALNRVVRTVTIVL